VRNYMADQETAPEFENRPNRVTFNLKALSSLPALVELSAENLAYLVVCNHLAFFPTRSSLVNLYLPRLLDIHPGSR
jgi:hypothetical protein